MKMLFDCEEDFSEGSERIEEKMGMSSIVIESIYASPKGTLMEIYMPGEAR